MGSDWLAPGVEFSLTKKCSSLGNYISPSIMLVYKDAKLTVLKRKTQRDKLKNKEEGSIMGEPTN